MCLQAVEMRNMSTYTSIQTFHAAVSYKYWSSVGQVSLQRMRRRKHSSAWNLIAWRQSGGLFRHRYHRCFRSSGRHPGWRLCDKQDECEPSRSGPHVRHLLAGGCHLLLRLLLPLRRDQGGGHPHVLQSHVLPKVSCPPSVLERWEKKKTLRVKQKLNKPTLDRRNKPFQLYVHTF